MQILGGEAQLFGGGEVEHFGGEASPALPPLDETLMALSGTTMKSSSMSSWDWGMEGFYRTIKLLVGTTVNFIVVPTNFDSQLGISQMITVTLSFFIPPPFMCP